MPPVNINELLSLPETERRNLAEKLWCSLNENQEIEDLSVEDQTLLEQRWNVYQQGQILFSSSAAMHQQVFGK